MADIENTAAVPHGVGTGTVGVVTFKVNDPGSSPDEKTTSLVHEPDESGAAQPNRVAVIDGPDLVTRDFAVQRVNDSAAAPAIGDVWSYDHNNGGTASSWRITNVSTTRAKATPDQFVISCYLQTFEG